MKQWIVLFLFFCPFSYGESPQQNLDEKHSTDEVAKREIQSEVSLQEQYYRDMCEQLDMDHSCYEGSQNKEDMEDCRIESVKMMRQTKKKYPRRTFIFKKESKDYTRQSEIYMNLKTVDIEGTRCEQKHYEDFSEFKLCRTTRIAGFIDIQKCDLEEGYADLKF